MLIDLLEKWAEGELSPKDQERLVPIVVLLGATVGALIVFLLILSNRESLRAVTERREEFKKRAEEAREEIRARGQELGQEGRATIDELLHEAQQDLEDLQRKARNRMEEIRLQGRIAAKKAEIEYLKARQRAVRRGS